MEQGLGLTVTALNSIKLCQVVEADRRGEMVQPQLLLADGQDLLPDWHSLDVVSLDLQGIGMAQQRLEVAIAAQWLKLPLGQMPGRGDWREPSPDTPQPGKQTSKPGCFGPTKG